MQNDKPVISTYLFSSRSQVRTLKKELEVLREEQAHQADTVSAEATTQLVEENKRLQDECDQERMAYQKLLKGYNQVQWFFLPAIDELVFYRSIFFCSWKFGWRTLRTS